MFGIPVGNKLSMYHEAAYINTFNIMNLFVVYSFQSCPTLITPWTVAARLLYAWYFSGKNTGVGCHFLLQGIFRTQRSNPGLLHWQLNSSPSEALRKPNFTNEHGQKPLRVYLDSSFHFCFTCRKLDNYELS